MPAPSCGRTRNPCEVSRKRTFTGSWLPGLVPAPERRETSAVLTMAKARRIALSLPETTEEDHFGMPSFRVRKKIFATVPDGRTIRIMLGPDEVSAATSADPGAFEELWWGKKLAGVTVHLAEADQRQVAGLLGEAWRGKAPKALAKALATDRVNT